MFEHYIMTNSSHMVCDIGEYMRMKNVEKSMSQKIFKVV